MQRNGEKMRNVVAMNMEKLQAPFPYFGGKSSIAPVVWQYLGSPGHYIEPFFGSGAVLLQRPHYDSEKHTETICDLDCNIANLWRAMQFDPDETAKWCDWPVNHADLNARRKFIISKKDYLSENLQSDPKWFDAELAGYWIWAASCWIGHGLTTSGRPHLGDKRMGVHKGQIPYLSGKGMGVHTGRNIADWFNYLSERLKKVRVVFGDWSRVCGGNWQDNFGDSVGFFFDPPYGKKATRSNGLYDKDSLTVSDDVREWCLERGRNPSYRIVLAGYIEEHQELLNHGWTMYRYKVVGGYGNISIKNKGENKNRFRETLFISPHCLKNSLFDKV